MMKPLMLIVLLLTFLPVSRPAVGQTLKQHPLVKSNVALLDAWIDSEMAYGDIPGLAIAIVHDQEVIFSKAYGFADTKTKREMTLSTSFRLASHSKLFTALAIMRLRDAGKLRLDDPVDSHLDWFRLGDSKEDATPVTIRQLLTHSSGLPREGVTAPFWTDGNFPSMAEIRRTVPRQEPVFEPATKLKYSNLNFVLLGEIVSTVSGAPLEDYIHRYFFEPIGMSNSAMRHDGVAEGELAVGYGRRLPDGSRESFPTSDVRGFAAAAGLTSSVNDMAEFVKWQFRLIKEHDSEDVLKSTTLREMQKIQWVHPDWNAGFGLGFHAIKNGTGVLTGHMGGLQGFKTATYVDPDTKVGVIVYGNSLDAQPYPGEPRSVLDRAFEWVGNAVSKSQGTAPPESLNLDWEPFWGTYRSIWGDIFVFETEGSLVIVDIHSADPMATLAKLEPLKGKRNEFQVIEGDPYVYLGETATFTGVADGRATTVRIGATVSRRIISANR